MLLSDDPRTLADFLPLGSVPVAHPVAALSEEDRRLWGVFSGSDRVWVPSPDLASAFWRRVLVVGHAEESQFDVLRERLPRDAADGGPVACLALAGRKFHGHRGRPWQALEGNLHVSVAVRPRCPVSRVGMGLTMLPAVATVDAVRAATGGRLVPDVKWVNDVLVAGRKVAGVLTATQSQGSTLELVVMGIGLNVATRPELVPSPFVPAATCLHDALAGSTFGLAHVFWQLLDALASRYETLVRDGPATLFGAYRAASIVLGRRVRVWEEGLDDAAPPAAWPPTLAEGVVLGMDPDLSLRLEGRRERVARGRLAFEESCRAHGL